MSFNGSGYADMNSAEDYIDSYIAYKALKKKPDAILLAKQYRDAVLPEIETLLNKTYGAGREPNRRVVALMKAYRENTQLL